MDRHANLVNSLISAFINRDYTILNAANGSYTAPAVIGRHEPDIMAQDQNGLIHIGEAKTIINNSDQVSKEQFVDFSTRIMSEGPLRGKKVILHIIVPKEQSNNLRQFLTILGLANKIGDNIFIWID